MNKSSSSSSPISAEENITSGKTKRYTAAVIPLDYNYKIMSPSSLSHKRQDNVTYHARPINHDEFDMDVENQYNSLFGDPVPPPAPQDFLSTTFERNIFQTNSVDISSEEDVFGQTVTLNATQSRLFPNIPYNSTFSRHLSKTNPIKNFDILPNSLPRLQPPDIQILPNSSGGSSSETKNSPNYALLTPDDIFRRQSLYDGTEPTDVSELIETITVSNANETSEYTEATRRVSNFSADFKSNVGSLSDNIPETSRNAMPATFNRQFSNESYSSSEWFRPAQQDFPEFSKMPKLRPSSKNIMSIKREEMPLHDSPVAAMINDSNASSSGEERVLDTTQVLEAPTVSLHSLAPLRPPDPSPSCLLEMESNISLPSEEYLSQARKISMDSFDSNFQSPPPPAAPPPIPPPPKLDETVVIDDAYTLKGDMSPVIFKDSVTTGSEYKVEQARLHKRTSFTIISEKSPQSSGKQSPLSHIQKSPTHSTKQLPKSMHKHKEITTTSSSSSKPTVKSQYYLQQKSLTSTQLKLPHLSKTNLLTSDDSPRPSVQFDMSGRYSPTKMPQKSILQQRESITSTDTLPLAIPTRRASIPISDDMRKKKYETLPLITDPYRTSIPRLNSSSSALGPEVAVIPPGALPRPLKPNPNPTRLQRGLLRIINNDDNMSRIPLPSNWSSMDDLAMHRKRKPSLKPLNLPLRRRSSSTSPERRSSTLTASDRRSSNLSTVTTSDFSFRRPSFSNRQSPTSNAPKTINISRSNLKTRRPSLAPPYKFTTGTLTPRAKISKPTTLSPIIGTPNKDSSSNQSPMHTAANILINSGTASDASRRNSLSKIPIRAGNNNMYMESKQMHLDSRPESRVHSRSNSPMKKFSSQQPQTNLTMHGMPSRTSSRNTLHTQSQPNSRAPSRSTSRASTRPISRTTSRPTSRAASRSTSRSASRPTSRAASRPNSRMEQAKDLANSRSNSRLSVSSTTHTSRFSPNMGYMKDESNTRRKSISLSPQSNRKHVLARRLSISPTNKFRSSNRGRSKDTKKKLQLQRKTSVSRIPMRTKSAVDLSKSPRKTSPIVKSSPRRSNTNSSFQSASANKAPNSVQKSVSSVKRTSTSTNKKTAAANKQPNNSKKTGINLKREHSNLQKNNQKISEMKNMKREPTGMSLRKTNLDLKQTKQSKDSSKLPKKSTDTKEGSKVKEGSKKVPANISTNQNNVGKKMANASDAVNSKTGTSGVTGGDGVTKSSSGIKRQPTNMSLMRIGSTLSMLSKKRAESSITRKITEESVSETDEKSNGSKIPKVASAGQLISTDGSLPAAIIEKSQKTLENIQKTVTVATDEIHKTINENLTDLKSFETDMGKMSDSAASPTLSVATVVENRSGKSGATSVSRIGTAEGEGNKNSTGENTGVSQKSPKANTQPIEATVSVVNNGVSGTGVVGEVTAATHLTSTLMDNADTAERVSVRAISVMPEVDCESANFQNFEMDIADKMAAGEMVNAALKRGHDGIPEEPSTGSADDYKTEGKRRSPDGQGESQLDSGEKNNSQEFLEVKDDDNPPKGCCPCCFRFCLPCRRARCVRCCRRNKNKNSDESTQPVLSATSSATTTNLEVIDETRSLDQKKKTSCWQKLNCCKSCKRKKSKTQAEEEESVIAERQSKMEGSGHATMPTTPIPEQQQQGPMSPTKQNKCGLCLSKIFCCRSVNKIDPKTGHETEVNKCCFCIPCICKRGPRGSTVSSVGGSLGAGSAAWQDPERGISATDASVLQGVDETPKDGCCKRFWSRVFFCRKKKVPKPSESRRQSIKAPPPPTEDTRRKLHVDLVEYNSKMKGAIPVLPLFLAWFCAICNTVVPGLGTLLSGIFCICIGIPRFSQHDSAKARVGSLIINIIVAVAQLFCVLFCFVGWGWSIWWGTIMLKCARKLNKIKKVEQLEKEEERRQAEAAAAIEAAGRAIVAAEAEAAKA